MTSSEVRNSFLQYFADRQHRVVPSASLLPTAPNLLFTNAGMNPFVPIFLGEEPAEETRVADTQKCIRAGGKHNDLEDVGLDGYHHTFFEMLGNWSFGDYFKEEAIHWAWELLTKEWKFPKDRLYVTVYRPGKGDPAEEDTEATEIWTDLLSKEGLDPEHHICYSGKKDNFWMMGETGPCGPCSEIHIDLTPDRQGPSLVNADSPWCIEIWNLVFIQFNARSDGSLVPLKERHIDTGMGLERVCGILASSKSFSEFKAPPSNYASDLFTPIFTAIEKMTSHRYSGNLPSNSTDQLSIEEGRDCAFRVIADHIRTLSCAIADGILPGNEGRNYVIRRILRRAILYGRQLDLPEIFLSKLVAPTIQILGDPFPELKAKQKLIEGVIRSEEESFSRTLDRGLQTLEKMADQNNGQLSGQDVFILYDTYGFPVDLTQLIAREKKLDLDLKGFDDAMEAQRTRARSARKTCEIEVSSESHAATPFVGFESEQGRSFETTVLDSIEIEKDRIGLVMEKTPFYAEMGGQIGDSGVLESDKGRLEILDTIKDKHGRILHLIPGNTPDTEIPQTGEQATLKLDLKRRQSIEINHTATHLLNWALREVLGSHIQQAGSWVGPDRLRFDFNHFQAVLEEELQKINDLVNEAIRQDHPVAAYEIAFRDKPEDVVAAFGEKYGNIVRVIDIGGVSKELCGGTHTGRSSGLQVFAILSETAIAAGVRRIEALAGKAALDHFIHQRNLLKSSAEALSCRPEEVQQRLTALYEEKQQLEKTIKVRQQQEAQIAANQIKAKALSGESDGLVKEFLGGVSPSDLRGMAIKLSKEISNRAFLLVSSADGKVTVVASSGTEAIDNQLKAGEIVRKFCEKIGGKGGGKADLAMGGAKDNGMAEETLKKFKFPTKE